MGLRPTPKGAGRRGWLDNPLGGEAQASGPLQELQVRACLPGMEPSVEMSREVGKELAPRTCFFRKSEPLLTAEILPFLHYRGLGIHQSS